MGAPDGPSILVQALRHHKLGGMSPTGRKSGPIDFRAGEGPRFPWPRHARALQLARANRQGVGLDRVILLMAPTRRVNRVQRLSQVLACTHQCRSRTERAPRPELHWKRRMGLRSWGTNSPATNLGNNPTDPRRPKWFPRHGGPALPAVAFVQLRKNARHSRHAGVWPQIIHCFAAGWGGSSSGRSKQGPSRTGAALEEPF